MNASYRLNKLLSNLRHQKKCGWLDKIANATDFTKSAFMVSWKFPVLLIVSILGAFEIGTHFNAMDVVFYTFVPPLILMAACGMLQVIHIERISILSEGHRKQLATYLSNLKNSGTHEDQHFVLEIAKILRDDQFENYHAFWWNSLGLALSARLEELNSVVPVAIEIDVETQLDCLHNPPPNKKLKL